MAVSVKLKSKPNGAPSSKDPSVQRLYAELDRIAAETLDPDTCQVRACKDRLQVLKQRTTELSDAFDLILAKQEPVRG